MENNNLRLIVTLEAADVTAEKAWSWSHNHDRYLPADSLEDEFIEYSSREPARSSSASFGSRLQLIFDKRPRDINHEFVFESDSRIFDVLLSEKADEFSDCHFCIAFNEKGKVVLRNMYNRVASVSYNGEEASERNHFTWILFDTYKNIIVTIAKENLNFKVVWPDKDRECKDIYEAHRNKYLEKIRDAMPWFDQLDVQSQQITAQVTQQHSSRQQPIYLLKKELGSGTSGTVYKTVGVSTGCQYATKEFHRFDWKREVEILRLISRVSTAIFDDESFIWSIAKKYIVQFVDFTMEQKRKIFFM